MTGLTTGLSPFDGAGPDPRIRPSAIAAGLAAAYGPTLRIRVEGQS